MFGINGGSIESHVNMLFNGVIFSSVFYSINWNNFKTKLVRDHFSLTDNDGA